MKTARSIGPCLDSRIVLEISFARAKDSQLFGCFSTNINQHGFLVDVVRFRTSINNRISLRPSDSEKSLAGPKRLKRMFLEHWSSGVKPMKMIFNVSVGDSQ